MPENLFSNEMWHSLKMCSHGAPETPISSAFRYSLSLCSLRSSTDDDGLEKKYFYNQLLITKKKINPTS